MAFVDTVHCPDSAAHKVGLKCLKTSRNEPNRLTLCHRFDPGQTCRVPLRRQRYCIDRFEYPSRRAAHPPVMVSAYDAAGLCAEKGKRMCWESEWTAACEGPDHKPFPYGHERSKAHCNIDNPYRQPSLKKVHSRSERVRDPELLRLDQSVASGAMDTCKSDFGVYDTTGNLDEWVRSEWRRGKSGFAALKGGAWGHVRNACRPVTTSHSPQWSYYFVSFRCCADADPNMLPPLPDDGVSLWTPPADAPPATPGGRPIDRGWPRENPK
jgi:sulfatase modifying factor 1